jgi:GTPase
MFQTIAEQQETVLQRGRTGVLLKSGDFIEGDFNGIRNGEIDIGSVVLGPKKVSVNQAVAVILRHVRSTPANYEVTTHNGGLYRAATLRLQNDAVLVSDPALGAIKIPVGELRDLRAR